MWKLWSDKTYESQLMKKSLKNMLIILFVKISVFISSTTKINKIPNSFSEEILPILKRSKIIFS